jgi:predicted phage baseplate assembly protein
MALIDAWAVGADVLTFYQERIANEGYLRTATERRSVLELARLIDYRLRPGVAASVYLAYTVEKDSPAVTIPAGARAQSIPAPGEQMQTFETSDPVEAHYEWNALKPRLTRPQNITSDNVANLGDLWIAGTTSNLKPNDRLLFLFGDLVTGQTAVRLVQAVEPHPESGRSRVVLQPVAPVAAPPPIRRLLDFPNLLGALAAPPTLQPANSLRLARSVATALGKTSDARPQLLLNFETRITGSFYRAWSSVQHGRPSPALTGVYAMRIAAPLFGYNAPHMPEQPPVITLRRAAAAASSDGDWPVNEQQNKVQLDNAYDGVSAGSFLLIQKQGSDEPTVAQAKTVQVHPRTDYGISGKTTDIDLVADGASVGWPAPTDMTSLRTVQVYAQSELLPLAELTITDTVGNFTADDAPSRVTADDAKHIELDGTVDGFKPGRWAIVEGRRADVPGTDAVTAAELVMVEAVEQGVDPELPGDTVHSTLVFANDGLAYSYQRDTVSIYANVVRATHGETRNEVLGSGNGAATMQAFVLKQPPLTYVSAATPDGVQSTLTVRVNSVQWHETRNLAFVGANERSFVTASDDDGKTTVTFGDGAHGARLPSGVENVTATYRNGIGTPGNVQAQQISLLATRPLGVKAVINPLRASGGADAETRDQARRNVPLAVLALDRLVSVPDYADFARTFGGVGKAAAVKLGDRVVVTIAGAGDAPIDPTSDLYRNLLLALQRYGDPSLMISLGVRELLALTLSVKVGLAPDYAWESVEPQVRAALLDAFGFERRALAQNVYLSEIVGCIQAVRGVAWVDVDALSSLDEQTIIAGFTDKNDDDGNADNGQPAGVASPTLGHLTTAAPPRVQALPARYDADGTLHPAQLAYLLPDVPDTLLLQEAT